MNFYCLKFCLLILLLALAGCQDENAPKLVSATAPSDAATPTPERIDNGKVWQREVEAARHEKDRDLKLSQDSPIPAEERASFAGLKYFPVDTAYRIESRLKRYDKPERIKMLTSTGEQDEYIRYGQLEFTLAGTACQLDVFKSANDSAPRLFVPFKDGTSGKESYGAGRYIEIEEDGGNNYVLDFNLAYNPYCAYNTHFSCPIPPAQNRLSVAVRAGEKAYHD